jgi:hypothetical protein
VGGVFSILPTTLLMTSGVSFWISDTNMGMGFLHMHTNSSVIQ